MLCFFYFYFVGISINPRGIRTVGGVPPYRETIGYVARGLVVYRLLRQRQMFPSNFVTSVYPTAVSESVARVWLKDPEIGFNGSLLTNIANPIFLNAGLARQDFSASVQPVAEQVQTKIPPGKLARRISLNSPTNISIPSAENLSEDSTNNGKTEEKPVTRSSEVYYEPRTGGRFQTRNGKIERLAESGELIVGNQTVNTLAPSIRARGSFFGGSKPLPK